MVTGEGWSRKWDARVRSLPRVFKRTRVGDLEEPNLHENRDEGVNEHGRGPDGEEKGTKDTRDPLKPHPNEDHQPRPNKRGNTERLELPHQRVGCINAQLRLQLATVGEVLLEGGLMLAETRLERRLGAKVSRQGSRVGGDFEGVDVVCERSVVEVAEGLGRGAQVGREGRRVDRRGGCLELVGEARVREGVEVGAGLASAVLGMAGHGTYCLGLSGGADFAARTAHSSVTVRVTVVRVAAVRIAVLLVVVARLGIVDGLSGLEGSDGLLRLAGKVGLAKLPELVGAVGAAKLAGLAGVATSAALAGLAGHAEPPGLVDGAAGIAGLAALGDTLLSAQCGSVLTLTEMRV
jgi:hypothetical protein